MKIELNEREVELITTALYILAGQCVGDEVHHELSSDLGGTPDDEEVWALKERFRDE